MALDLTPPLSDSVLTFQEFKRRCDRLVRRDDEASLQSLAADLAALARNKSEFANYVYADLVGETYRPTTGTVGLMYSDQCTVLLRGDGYYIRIASWDRPASGDEHAAWGKTYFSYDFAHHHDFSLLTVGLLGPGYVTENYWLDAPPQVLMPGDPVELESQPSQQLSEGSVLLYRKWHDIHVQHPPRSFSVSLNLIVEGSAIPQYSFDVRRMQVGTQIGGKYINELRALAIADSVGLQRPSAAVGDLPADYVDLFLSRASGAFERRNDQAI